MIVNHPVLKIKDLGACGSIEIKASYAHIDLSQLVKITRQLRDYLEEQARMRPDMTILEEYVGKVH